MGKWKLICLIIGGMILMLSASSLGANPGDFVKVNQVGYLPLSPKLVVVVSAADMSSHFSLVNQDSGEVVYQGELGPEEFDRNSGQVVRHGDFTSFQTPGIYTIKVDGLGTSYPFVLAEQVYQPLLINTVRAYSLQRSATEIDDPITGLKINNGHSQDAQARMFFADPFHEKGDVLDVSGGWYDAGDYGKYIPPAAIAVAQILLGFELNSQAFSVGQLQFPFEIKEADRNLPDILVELKFELEWMEKMQRPDGAVYHKVSGLKWPGFIRPESDRQPRYVFGMSTFGTAQYAGVMAMAARVYKSYDPQFAARMLNNAKLAQDYLTNHPDPEFVYSEGQDNGSGGYRKDGDGEERYWALAELYKTTQDEHYHMLLVKNYAGHITKRPSFITWANAHALGHWAYLTSTGGNDEIRSTIRSRFLAAARNIVTAIELDGYNNALDSREYTWASAKNMVAKGNILLMAFHLDQKPKYLFGALDQLHNVLGRSATGYSYLTGAGSRYPREHHHRILHSTRVEIPGLLVGGPNRYGGDPDLDQYITTKHPAPAQAYLDVRGSWSSNEYAIDYTAPLVFALAHLTDHRLFKDKDL